MKPIEITSFGRLPDGRATRLFSLRAPGGFQVDVSDFGGAIVRLLTPDRNGQLGDVVLGFDSAARYAAQQAYIGTLIGRVGNRIAAGRFTLDGKTYTLPTNNAPAGIPCCLHGGPGGFHQVLWEAETVGDAAVRLSHVSPDGAEGFPGRLTVAVTFTVTERELRLDYEAATDRPTPVALTHHAYFNLAGEGLGPITGHELELRAAAFTPVTPGLIPTGRIESVAGTALDFTTARAVGARIDAAEEQLARAGGYDHNFVLARAARARPETAAIVHDPITGRRLEVLTTEPGVQFYSGNFLDGSLVGKSGRAYGRRSGFCLETKAAT